MVCVGCGQRMHRETTIKVVRARALLRPRAIVSPGWHCWTCGAAVTAEPPPAASAALARTPAPTATALLPFWRPPTILATEAGQLACANAQA